MMKRRTVIALLCGLLLGFAVPGSPQGLPQDEWAGVRRIVAVGDLHGDYDRCIEVLRAARIIDRSGNWSGGRTHLVQTGDIHDRGPHARRILDLFMKLEKQAERAGGRVHVLIGNHEAMNLYGDLRYVPPEAYEAFRTPESEQVRQAFYEREIEELRTKAEAAGSSFAADQAFRAKWEQEHPPGFFEYRFAYGPNGEYGRWLRGRNAAVKIGATLFLHGGICPKYAGMPIRTINETVRRELGDFTLLEGGIVRDGEGPLWCRELARGDEAALAGHVDEVLRSLGASRIVIGHTPTQTAVLPRFQGKVVMIDVGMSAYYGGPPACLVIENDVPWTLHRGKKLRLPADSGQGLLRYLEAAAALDPPPSPIEKLIRELRAPAPAVKP